jgi:glycosyltransferase involved in cell wall biosynthesis
MNTCHAFASQPDTKVTLLINHNSEIQQQFGMDVWDFYGIKNNFEIVYFPKLFVFIKKQVWIHKLIAFIYIYKYISATFNKKQEKYVIYSRHVKISLIIKFISILKKNKYFQGNYCELHSLSSNKRSLNSCEGLIAISQTLKADLLKNKFMKDQINILVAHDGVDLSKYSKKDDTAELKNKMKIDGDALLIGYVGKINTEKGVDLLFNALNKIVSSEKIILLLVGKVFNQAYINKALVIKNVKVIFTGFIAPLEIASYILMSDILVLPSTKELSYWKYTSPIKLFEYMAAGKPIVASALPGIKEIIKNNKNGLLFKPGNCDELASALNKLIIDKKLRETISQNAKEDVIYYSWNARAESITNFMKSNFC